MELEILYEDEHYVAINKPPGLLVHRSKIAGNVRIFALQTLSRQLGRKVYPIHRLDRKTSGVLLFSFESRAAERMQSIWHQPTTQKRYLAIVRGFFPETIDLDYELTNDRGTTQQAITHFRLLQTTEMDWPFGKHATSRYSLVEAIPKTGRMHQIRKHLNHLRHPIIGDRPHGCNKQNRLFKEKCQLQQMMLHAQELSFQHPFSDQTVHIKAQFPPEFARIAEVLKLLPKLN